MRRLAHGLVHYPVLDKGGATVTTAITNLDLHDIARCARTYGCTDYFVIHPIAAQRDLAERICRHWIHGSSGVRIPDRKDALSLVRVVSTLDDATRALGGEVDLWITSAREVCGSLGFHQARRVLEGPGAPVLLLFGTGWGLADHVVEAARVRLTPILGPSEPRYNHLSVRAACAVTLDRLRGLRED